MWGAGICMWTGNEAARAKHGDYPISLIRLPISVALGLWSGN